MYKCHRFPIQSEEYEEPIINLTPLIDVVFVILIIFIVIAPLLEMDRIALAQSGKSEASISFAKESSISIYVHANNEILLNGNKVALINLPKHLKEAKMQHPTVTPQLFHDKLASFGTYQAIKNAAESAGFDHLEIVLKP